MNRPSNVSRETVAKAGQVPERKGAVRRARYSEEDFAVIAKVQNLRAEGMAVSNRDIAAALGRTEGGLKSKLSRLNAVREYRRTGVGTPGRRSKDGVIRRGRRADREIPDPQVEPVREGGHSSAGDDRKARAA